MGLSTVLVQELVHSSIHSSAASQWQPWLSLNLDIGVVLQYVSRHRCGLGGLSMVLLIEQITVSVDPALR